MPPGAFAFSIEGTDKLFLADKKYRTKILSVRWRFNPKTKRARGYFGKNKTRQFLHTYVLSLAKKYYPEVTFENDWWDCRLINLKPYDRSEDGARRRPFKNKQRKGVIFHKRKKQFCSMIRVHGKLRHLGYFKTADEAAKAYALAWNAAHPSADPMDIL